MLGTPLFVRWGRLCVWACADQDRLAFRRRAGMARRILIPMPLATSSPDLYATPSYYQAQIQRGILIAILYCRTSNAHPFGEGKISVYDLLSLVGAFWTVFCYALPDAGFRPCTHAKACLSAWAHLIIDALLFSPSRFLFRSAY
jgi:hypothetical protein